MKSKKLITSKQWWESIKKNPKALNRWLENQFHGEQTAAHRLEILLAIAPMGWHFYTLVKIISEQELNHAFWIGTLLEIRGITPHVLNKKERYWAKTLPDGKMSNISIKRLAAIGAHAEKMRLERIRVIASDKDAPKDIREVFKRILPQERFHEAAFAMIAGPEELKATRANHKRGKNALGLIA